MNVDRLVEQARDWLQFVETPEPINVSWLVAGLADAAEQSREVTRNDARALLRWRERASELDARVADLQAENAELRREAGGLSVDGRTVPELEARVAALEAGIRKHRRGIRSRDVGQGIHRGGSAQSVNEHLWALLDGRVPPTGQETT